MRSKVSVCEVKVKTSFGSMVNYLPSRLNNMLGSLRTPHKLNQFPKPVPDLIDLEVKITVRDQLTHKTKEVMFDGALSDETLLMIYMDVDREIRDGANTRSKSKKGSGKTA